MEITVRIENVYGKVVIRPVCNKAIVFADIAGTKTLTPQAIERIKFLGYTVNVQQDVVTL